MTELFPGLSNLRGGQKDQWIRNNLDLIAALNDHIGFEETAKVLNMKAQTLSRALQLAEGSHRPVITLAEKAMSRGVLNENKINQLAKELNHHREALVQCFVSMRQVRDNLSQYFQLQASANALMAEVMSNRSTMSNEANFTEHISSVPKRKVGPSERIGYGRLFSYRGPRRKQLLGPLIKDSKHRRTERRPGGV